MKIQDFINNRHKYKVDKTYQRPADAWSKEDNQCLIDTILRGEPVPIFFMNSKSSENIFYIVDGQQRLNAIEKFYDNKIKLNKKFSGKENHGKSFNNENPVSDEQRDAFLGYNLNFHLLEDYDDERIRMIFSRLQRGKPLQIGERLNAKPGEIVYRMREIALHPFLSKSVGIYKGRYGVYPDAARILFYEKYGAKQCGSKELFDFFDNNQDMPKNDKDYKNVISTLNFLALCFPPDPGDYKYIEKHAWVLAVYTIIRELKLNYALGGQEKSIKKYIESFHSKVYSEDFRSSNQNYQRFYDNVRGGWSEKIIALRRDILIKDFLNKHNLSELSDRRQISDEEKIAAYAKTPYCTMCRKEFKDYKEVKYHHVNLYSKGGPTELSNISVLCGDCHNKIHGKSEIALPPEEELSDDEE
jgi:5-methylcytosine-specific restriction endonuclease McrA